MVGNSMRRGFTLIELLVTISIIAILSTIGLTLFSSTQGKARDSIRKQDLQKLGTALEIYLQSNNKYVINSGSCVSNTAGSNLYTDPNFSKLINGALPQDPKTKSNYCYESDGSKYKLYAKLEDNTDYILSSEDFIAQAQTQAPSQQTPTPSPISSPTPTPASIATPTPTPTPTPVPVNLPIVTTKAATNIGIYSAFINESINPNGSSTTGWWSYDATSPGSCNNTFGFMVPIAGPALFGSGTTAVSYSYQLLNLTGNTTYYFCAIAQNSNGISFGSLLSFLTYPVSPTNLIASAVSSSQINLSWTAPTNGASSYSVYRCQNSLCTNFAPIATGITGTSYPNTGLSGATAYRYFVSSVNATGDSYTALGWRSNIINISTP